MLPKPKPTQEKWCSNCVASRSHHTPIAVRHNPIVEFSSHIQMQAAQKSWAWRLGTLILLLERQAFMNVPMAQFTHFVHELASSTSQSLLGAAPPNPCPSTFTNLFHTNVYLVFFFSRFKVHLNILLLVSFTMYPRSLNFNNNSVGYPQNNMSSTSSTLIQFRSKNSHFHSRPIIQLFYRYGYSSTSIVDLL